MTPRRGFTNLVTTVVLLLALMPFGAGRSHASGAVAGHDRNGDGDNADPTTEVGGGNVVIHRL